MTIKNTFSCSIFILFIAVQSIRADSTNRYLAEIRFVQHRFIPLKVEVPAGMPLAIRVVNASTERIEFESFKLNREKVVEPGKTVTVNLPPLKAGRYDFYDDFHADVPEGEIVAR